MLSLVPTLLLLVQLIFLYFDREIFNISNNSLYLVCLIVFFNLLIITIVSLFLKSSSKAYSSTKLNKFLGNNHNSKTICFIFIFCFSIQVLINKNIPAIAALFSNDVFLYNTWGVQPFSGMMTLIFLLLLSERTSVWLGLIKDKPINKNNLYLIIMLSISLLMLRRDIFGLLLSSGAIILFKFLINSLFIFFKKFNLRKSNLYIFRNLICLFLSFLLIFTVIGNLRGSGSGLNRAYWQVAFVYVSSPLANSLSVIEEGNSNYLGIADFFLSRSNLGQKIIKSFGKEPGIIPAEILPRPNFNVVSSLGYYYQLFGKDYYLYMVILSSGILALLEKMWKKKYPILFIAILITASASIFSHFFGSLTMTIIFPLLYFLQTYKSLLR